MKVKISSLREGLNEWRERVDPADLDLDPDHFFNPIDVDLKVESRYGRIDIEIVAASSARFVCDRCCEDFSPRLTGECSVRFIKREEPFPDEAPGDDLRSYLHGQDELDVTTEVRDALLLAAPLRALCQDDCRGICPGCGRNLNVEACVCEPRPD